MLFVDCALSTSPGHVVFQRRTRVEHGLRHSSNCFRIYPHRCACADEYDGARRSVGKVVMVAGQMVDLLPFMTSVSSCSCSLPSSSSSTSPAFSFGSKAS